MDTPTNFASALPSERDMQIIRRKAARMRADHVRSLLNRLSTALKGRISAGTNPHRLDGGRVAG